MLPRTVLPFFLFLLPVLLAAQSTQILLDEDFSDWPAQPLAVDPVGDGGSSDVDFQQFWMADDARFLFLRIRLEEELNLQSDNDITIYLDTDNNPATGLSIHGMGAELSYNFGERSGVVRLGGDILEIGHDEIFMVTSPTVTSDQFEIGLDRESTFNGLPLFSGNEIRAVWRDESLAGDDLPNTGSVLFALSDDPVLDLPPFSIERPNADLLRIMTYNVQFDGFFESSKIPRFERILQATAPDIIGFQEIYDYSSGQTTAQVEDFLPNGQWYHAKVDPDIILVSRFPIEATYTIAGSGSGSSGNGAFLLDLRPTYNSHLLVLGAHTPCCDDDYNRQLEVDAMMAFVRDAKSGTGPVTLPENTPVVILGDMNLVGDDRQLETFITGDLLNNNTFGPDFVPDWDGTNLDDSKPYITGLPMTFTWFDIGSSFGAGRLDFIFYTGASLRLDNSYALFTPTLSPAQLSESGLQSADGLLASDHLPVIADFEVLVETSIAEVNVSDPLQLRLWPNPVVDSINLQYTLQTGGRVDLRLFDLSGREVRAQSWYQASGIYERSLGLSDLPSGTYQLLLQAGSRQVSRKVVRQ